MKLFVEQHGKKTICAMSEDTDFGRDVMDGARDQLKAMNVKLAAETLHKPTDTDFSASVARLRDANCDLIVVGGIVRDTVQIISAVRKTGWNVDMLGQAASYDEAVAAVPGGVTEGFYSMTPVLFVAASDSSPAVTKFAEAYKKEFGKEPNFAAQIGYTGAQLVVQALKNAGKDLTADSFVVRHGKHQGLARHLWLAGDELQPDQAPGIERVVPVRREGRSLGAGRHNAGWLLIAGSSPAMTEGSAPLLSRGEGTPTGFRSPTETVRPDRACAANGIR